MRPIVNTVRSCVRLSWAHGHASGHAHQSRRPFHAQAGRTITAAVARDPKQPFTIEQLQLRPPRVDEILVRLVATGLCHTDVVIHERGLADFPIVLGHEGVGVVEEVGSAVIRVTKGDHVVMSYASCGSCRHCHQAKPAYCFEHGRVNFGGRHLDGTTSHSTTTSPSSPVSAHFFQQSSFASHALATQNNVIKVDKNADLASLAPLGCGVQTGAGAVLNTFNARVGSTLAVFGCGAVGLSAVMAAQIAGCAKVIAIDLNPSRLAMARELGATHTIHITSNTDGKQVVEQIKDIGGGGVDYAFDTTGNKHVLRQAFDILNPLGVAGLVAGSPSGTEVSIDMLSLLPGRQLRGVIQGDAVPHVFIPHLITLHQQGRFPYHKLITYYDRGLADLPRAIRESKDPLGSVIKPVIRLSPP